MKGPRTTWDLRDRSELERGYREGTAGVDSRSVRTVRVTKTLDSTGVRGKWPLDSRAEICDSWGWRFTAGVWDLTAGDLATVTLSVVGGQ